jgi:hypothetical protein
MLLGYLSNIGRRRGGSMTEAWWLNGSAPDCCPAIPGSNPAFPQPTADCPSPGGLPPGMALGRGLTSVRGNRGKNCEKHIKKKKKYRQKIYIYFPPIMLSIRFSREDRQFIKTN